WMHNGLLKMGTAKMAGSVGNVVNMTDLLQRHDRETVRFLLLSTHYRSPIEYSEERLNEIRRSLEGFSLFFEQRYQPITKRDFYQLQAPTRHGTLTAATSQFLGKVAQLRAQFLECMDDDFNTGGAVGALYEMLTALNSFVDEQKLLNENPE